MAVMSYKCPNCGGGLTFDPKSQKMICEYCLSEFTKEEAERLGEEKAGDPEPDSAPGPDLQENASGNDGSRTETAEEAMVYICPSCGAQIVTEATTAASFCYYCHNPVVLSGRVSGEFLPDRVLPFAIDKKRAEEMFLSWIEKKKFVPKSFYSKDQVEKLSGVYFPYFLYSCKVDGRVSAEAEKVSSRVSGNTRITEHRQYRVEREGCLDVKNLTRNALSRSNRELVEGVLPFETEKMVPFSMGYLSGFMAEKRDMESHMFTPEAEREVRDYTVQNLTSSITGYSSFRVKNSDTGIRDAKWQYALLPVWVMTYRHKEKGKTYYFTMNGQTGKICGKLPVDQGKMWKLFAGIFFPMFAFLMIGGWFL